MDRYFFAIISFFAVSTVSGCLFAGCFVLDRPSTTTSTLPIVCNHPYIVYGEGCCLDRDSDGLCDASQTTSTTPAETSSTTFRATSTSTSAQPTTTTLYAECATNSDCGMVRNYTKCSSEGNVIMYVETPYCSSPGQETSKCVMKSKTTPYRACEVDEKCQNGKCIKNYGFACELTCSENLRLSEWDCVPGDPTAILENECPTGSYRARSGDEGCEGGLTPEVCCCMGDNVEEDYDTCDEVCRHKGGKSGICIVGSICQPMQWIEDGGKPYCVDKHGKNNICCCTSDYKKIQDRP